MDDEDDIMVFTPAQSNVTYGSIIRDLSIAVDTLVGAAERLRNTPTVTSTIAVTCSKLVSLLEKEVDYQLVFQQDIYEAYYKEKNKEAVKSTLSVIKGD